MNVDENIVRRIVAAVNEIQPDDLWATASPDALVLNGGKIKVAATWSSTYQPDQVYPMDAQQFAMAVLQSIQEIMIEEYARGGWPPADPKNPNAPQRGVKLPVPHAEVVDEELRWWFGRKEQPAFTLKPVPLNTR